MESTVAATSGDPENSGLSFYPAVKVTNRLLPQSLKFATDTRADCRRSGP